MHVIHKINDVHQQDSAVATCEVRKSEWPNCFSLYRYYLRLVLALWPWGLVCKTVMQGWQSWWSNQLRGGHSGSPQLLPSTLAQGIAPRLACIYKYMYVTLDPRAGAKVGADEMSLSDGSCTCIYMYKHIHAPRQHGKAQLAQIHTNQRCCSNIEGVASLQHLISYPKQCN